MKNNNLQSPAPQENKMGTMPIAPLLAEARSLGISKEELLTMIGERN